MASRGSSLAASNGPGSSEAPQEQNVTKIPHILPHERVFPVQIGGELFKLSGASLSSDAPSYFSQYFLCQIKAAEESGDDVGAAIRTLYIDRDPTTFHDIALHLQGYHVTPRDGTHFVRLFADAQFYSLPRLISQLYDESIFISIGHREFQIPRDIFTDPGNTPNYFSLGFAAFFSRPDDLFPGLDREGLIRPPSILPPSVPNRSADTFAELLRLLRGYPVSIRDENHRAELLRDARYFHFRGLEQRLIPCSLSFNQARAKDEITLRLENVQKSGARVARLFEVLAVKLNLPAATGNSQSPHFRTASASPSTGAHQLSAPGNTPLSQDLVLVSLDDDASITLDGKEYTGGALLNSADEKFDDDIAQPRKRRRTEDGGPREWVVRTGQWRLRIRSTKTAKAPYECVLEAVKIDAFSSELERNSSRSFLL
uniref:Potassium channel tetramerisation-type BTB domain-containing protein n=1 Tax=Bionectria ochroleuca TaxID=29856 RepID=A0A0B7K4Y0_BIOOC